MTDEDTKDKSKELKEEILKPINNPKSKKDKELQELEVESTAGGIGGSGG